MGEAVQAEGRALDWALASRALPGQSESGDRALVRPLPNGGVLVAVVDALGHGAEAAAPAGRAISILERFAHDPLPSLVQRCHTELFGSRGVVMSLASYRPDDHSMTWLGVGNVEGVLVSADPGAKPRNVSLMLRAGIVGADLPRVSPWVVPLSAGDTLIFTTDGIRPGFSSTVTAAESPKDLADRVLAQYAKDTDDALVLVVRYRGDA